MPTARKISVRLGMKTTLAKHNYANAGRQSGCREACAELVRGILQVNIWAIVPVKPFNRSKSRLASVLDAEEREELSRKMLVDTLRTLSKVNAIDGILVVSRDSSALTLARNEGAQTVAESGNPELNDALTRATQAVMLTWGARGVLIVSSDLPLMQPSDIKAMLDMARLTLRRPLSSQEIVILKAQTRCWCVRLG